MTQKEIESVYTGKKLELIEEFNLKMHSLRQAYDLGIDELEKNHSVEVEKFMDEIAELRLKRAVSVDSEKRAELLNEILKLERRKRECKTKMYQDKKKAYNSYCNEQCHARMIFNLKKEEIKNEMLMGIETNKVLKNENQ